MIHTSQTSTGNVTGTFSITPRGPYSLAAAASFEFGPKHSQPEGMQLAFALDGGGGTAAVALHQDDGGDVVGSVQGTSDLDAVRAQVARILSLDQDATAWVDALGRDPVMRDLEARRPGFRPVLFHSPYEAAAWGALYGRKTLQQVRRLRDRIAAEYGDPYDVEGQRLAAFPTPQRLLDVVPGAGLGEVVVDRLHTVARAALAEELETDRLRSMDQAAALADLQRLPGIGPFFSGLILYRAVGVVDAWHHADKLDACVRHFYGIDPADEPAFQAVGDRLRPFRTWATVVLRRYGYEEGIA